MAVRKIMESGIVLALALTAMPALAAVEVRFVEPDKYADVPRAGKARDEVLMAIQTHLRLLGEKEAPVDLLIEITDVDLAGQVEPQGSRMDMIRVLRSVTRPAITLRFVLSKDGREVRRGEARLSDLAYLDRLNRYSSGDPIRYEKQMLDEWFSKEFAASAAKP